MMTAKIYSILLAVLVLVVAGTGFAAPEGSKLAAPLEKALEVPSESFTIWVHFSDKGLPVEKMQSALADRMAELDKKTRARRSKIMSGSQIVTEADLPVASSYLERIDAIGASRRHVSRWLNAASYEASPEQIEQIAGLSFVQKVNLVKGGRCDRPKPVPEASGEAQAMMAAARANKNLDVYYYGSSYPGLLQINVPAAQATGLSGKGTTIAILDTGFDLSHECLQNLNVVGTWDFIHGTENVGNQPEENPNQTLYGTATLSALAGYSPSNLIGTAYGASFILAKTENLDSEVPVEEDNWIAALEWAEELGADIVNSGLGYFYWYDFKDLDGRTTLITIAAEMASARGVLVVNSAGDQGINANWPHIVPPADGRSVLAVGSIDLSNYVTYYSGPGPTYDGRTKPDVMALGAGTAIALSRDPNMYYFGYGTNYAVPLVSGVAAMILEQSPHLNPAQVKEALRETASRTILPDNYYGWGTIDALAAVNYWAPKIEHSALPNVEPGTGPFSIEACITSDVGLATSDLLMFWRRSGGDWNMVPLVLDQGDNYRADIWAQPGGTVIEYYLSAMDLNGQTRFAPQVAPAQLFSFEILNDTKGPVIVHNSLADQSPATWPPVLRLDATDDLGVGQINVIYSMSGGASEGPFPMARVGDSWELTFPWDYGIPSLEFSYTIIAQDTAEVPNFTIQGPNTFRILEHRGRVLLVDDQSISKSAPRDRRPDKVDPASAEKNSSLIQQWMTEAGFQVDYIEAEAVGSTSFIGYDAVFVSCGGNYGPLNYSELRRTMVAWAESGGRILVEGGEVAFAATDQYLGFPEVVEKVLHIESYMGDDGAELRPPLDFKDHFLVTRPHRLPVPMIIDDAGGMDWTACDIVMVADDAVVPMQSNYGSGVGGVVYYDNNTCPEGGQMVFFPFNLFKIIESDARNLLDNTMTFLVQKEPLGNSSISGRIKRVGQTDHSGIVVHAGPNHSAVTTSDGNYTITGLWGGSYHVTAAGPGFAPDSQDIDLLDDSMCPEVNLYLFPVQEVAYPTITDLYIPDNNTDGISSMANVSEDGELVGIEIDGDITHYSIGQLVITLTSPAGTSVVLHNRSGGTADDMVGTWPVSLFVDGPGDLDDFLGENPRGEWILKVVDAQFGATGSLNSWSLNLLVKPNNLSPVVDAAPMATRLLGNFPNPFNPQTNIDFELAAPGMVTMNVYDLKGRLVRTLARREFTAGQHSILWDGRDNHGAQPSSGFYFCRLVTKGTTQVAKMMLLR